MSLQKVIEENINMPHCKIGNFGKILMSLWVSLNFPLSYPRANQNRPSHVWCPPKYLGGKLRIQKRTKTKQSSSLLDKI